MTANGYKTIEKFLELAIFVAFFSAFVHLLTLRSVCLPNMIASGVMVLGLVFGLVTHLARGIGWAGVVHIAINVVIEWRNLS